METEDLRSRLADLFADPSVQIGSALFLLVFAFASCRVFAKAGFHAALGLLMLVPGVNLVMYLVLAFGRWPVRKQVRELRRVNRAVEKAHDRMAA